MLVFLLLKIVRGDFRYWVKAGSLSLPISLVVRFIEKVLTDFSLVMQMRHSFEVGGVLFSLLVVQNQVSCLVSGWVFLKYYGERDDMLEAETLWAGLQLLLGMFLVSAVAFVGLLDRKYLHTFFSWTTGPHYNTIRFRLATTDEQRLQRFSTHPAYCKEIKDDLQELIDDNWEDWMADKTEWLTDNVIAHVPVEYLKNILAKRLLKEGSMERRKSSTFIGMEGGGRASAKVQHDENADDSKIPPLVTRDSGPWSSRMSLKEQFYELRKPQLDNTRDWGRDR